MIIIFQHFEKKKYCQLTLTTPLLWLEFFIALVGEREKKLMALAGGLEEYTVSVLKEVFCEGLTAKDRSKDEACVAKTYKREMGLVGAPAVMSAPSDVQVSDKPMVWLKSMSQG